MKNERVIIGTLTAGSMADNNLRTHLYVDDGIEQHFIRTKLDEQLECKWLREAIGQRVKVVVGDYFNHVTLISIRRLKVASKAARAAKPIPKKEVQGDLFTELKSAPEVSQAAQVIVDAAEQRMLNPPVKPKYRADMQDVVLDNLKWFQKEHCKTVEQRAQLLVDVVLHLAE